MTRRLGLCVLSFLLVVAPALAEKRRSVGVGASSCVVGILDSSELWIDIIALDATHVYFADSFEFAVYRIPKNGGARTQVAILPGERLLDIAVDDATLYIATIPEDFFPVPPPGTIYAVPKSGGTPRTLVSGVILPLQLILDGTHLYWNSVGTVDFADGEIQSDGKIERVRRDGTGRQTLASGLSAPISLLLDTNDVYFSETGEAIGNASQGIRRVAKNGGAVTRIENTYVAGELAQTETDLIFYGGTLLSDRTGIYRLSKSGGAVQVLIEDDTILGGPRVDNGHAYYVNLQDDFNDALMRIPVGGGTPQFMLVPDMAEYDFEIDDCGVYYGTIDAELVKSAK